MKLFKFIPVLLLCLFLFGFTENLTPITVRELLENAKTLDNTPVLFVGEAIGQRLKEKDFFWVNVLDHEGNAIGIWMNQAEADRIKNYGNNTMSGDLLHIEGVFHKSCEIHGGDTDIHLIKLKRIETGKPRNGTPTQPFFLYAIVILVCLIFLLFFLKKKKDSCPVS